MSDDFLVSLASDPSRHVLAHNFRSILETTGVRDRKSNQLGIIITKVWEVNLLPPAPARTSGDKWGTLAAQGDTVKGGQNPTWAAPW